MPGATPLPASGPPIESRHSEAAGAARWRDDGVPWRSTRACARHTLSRNSARIVAVVLAVVLVSSAAVVSYATYDLAASFTDEVVDVEGQGAVPPDIGAIEGGVNLLVTGIDECEPEYAHLFG